MCFALLKVIPFQMLFSEVLFFGIRVRCVCMPKLTLTLDFLIAKF